MSTVSVISVVDDDPSVRAATSKFLKSHGYTVQAYSSAEHFLQSGRLNDTLCVIADLQMPGMSGLELLTMMRAQSYGVPFIFITAFPGRDYSCSRVTGGGNLLPVQAVRRIDFD